MKFVSEILDYFYPPHCLICEKSGKHPLCNDCLSQLEPRPKVSSLRPFNVLTIFSYGDAIRDIIHKMKFDGHEEFGILLAELSAPYLVGLGERTLIPVPIHPFRLRTRGFNQSAVIAKRLAKLLGWKYGGKIIQRTKNTLPQLTLNLEDRAENVKDAFTPHPFAKINSNKHYMLIDDIMTTSSTLHSCASVLHKMGITLLDALAITRAGNSSTIIVDSEYFM